MLFGNIKRLAEIAVLIPMVNFIAATTLLAAYAIGFGSNVGWYFTIDDVFSASLTGLLPVYIGFIYLAGSEAFKGVTRSHIPANTHSLYGPFYRRARGLGFARVSIFTLLLVIGVSFIGLIARHLVGMAIVSFGYITCVLTLILLVLMFRNIGEQFPNSEPSFFSSVTMVSIFVLVFVLSLGIDAGQRDRHLAYGDAYSSSSRCGDYIVLRKTGSMYLVLGSDDNHRLIDAECRERLTFPKVNPRAKIEDLPKLAKWLFL